MAPTVPSARRLAVALVIAAASGCWLEPALQAHVTLVPAVKASCVQVSVFTSDDTSGAPAVSTRIPRPDGKDELFVAVYKGSLPGQVWVSARPMFGAECADPLVPNGLGATRSGTFPPTGSTTLDLDVQAPSATEDADGDGFVGPPGGADCDDGRGSVNPGASEHCQQPGDYNCDGRIGCADPTCPPGACLAAPTHLAFVSNPKTQQAGACSGTAVTVETRDATNSAVPVVAPTTVTFSAPDANLGLFSQNGCSVALSTVTIPAGSSRASAFISGTVAGPARVAASAPGLGTVEQTETIQPGPTSQVVFTTPAQTMVPLNGCSAPVRVQLRDSFGNPTPVAPARNLNLASNASPGATFKFYPDALCANAPVTTTPIMAGGTSSTFHFKSTATAAGTVTITVTDGPRMATQAVGLVLRTPSQLAFTTTAVPVAQGVCSSPVTLQTQDSSGLPAPVLAPFNIPLMASGGTMTFHAGSTCAAPPISLATIPASTSSTTFYFKGNAGTPTITADGGAFGSPSQQQDITAPVPTTLAFATPAQAAVTAGQCSSPVDIQSRDGTGTPAPVSGATQVDLATSPSGELLLYQGGSCSGSPVSQTTLAAGNSTVTISFQGTDAGTTDIQASTPGGALAAATQTEGVVAAAASQVRIVAGTGQTLAPNACGAVTVELQDAFGNPVTATPAQVVDLLVSPTSALTFYTSTDCTTGATTTAQINAGAQRATFHFKGAAAGTPTITVDAQTAGLASDSTQVTIQSSTAVSVDFTSAVQNPVTAGACSAPVVITGFDSMSNVAPVGANTQITLGATAIAPVSFYAGAGCTGGTVTTVTIPGGQSTVTYSFKTNKAAIGTLTANTSSLGAASQPVTVVGAAPTHLAFSLGPVTVTAGSCSGSGTGAPLAVVARDAFNNLAPVAADTTVDLSGTNTATSSTNITFYGDSGCPAPGVTSVTIATGNSTTPSFYFKTNEAGTWAVSADSTGLTGAAQNETVTVGPPAALVFTSAAQMVMPGNCSGKVTFEVQDGFGNTSPLTGPTNISLAPTGDTFYRNGSCAQAIPGNVIGLNTNDTGGQYWFQAPGMAGSYTITISGVGSPTDQVETVQ